MRPILLLTLCAVLFASARAASFPASSTTTLTVDRTTGEIKGPVSAATFRTANSLGSGGGGGSGTVTSVSTGNLSPIFTVSIANATSTPAFTFTLSNAAQNAVLAGPSSGGTGAPSYRALALADMPGTLGTWGGITPSANMQALAAAANYAAMKALLSLDNVTNTSDANKPVSTAQQAALDLKASLAALVATNGSGPNAGNGLVHWSQLTGVPAGFADGSDDGSGGGSGTVTTVSTGNLSPLFTVSIANATSTPAFTFTLSNAAQNAVLAGPSSGGTGAPSYRALALADMPGTLGTWGGITPSANMQSLAAAANYAAMKALLSLDNVTNTSDANKPVSTAQQTALDLKVPTTRTVNGHALSGDVTVTKGDVALGNVDNTSDANKPVSTAQQTALDLKVSATAIDTVAERTALGLKSTTGGSPEVVSDHPTMGTTETFDLAAGNVHKGILDAASCAITLTGFTNGLHCSGSALLTQDATGGRLATWPGVVTSPTLNPAANSITRVDYWSVDGGATIFCISDYTTAGSGDASTNTSSSVDSEIALFSGTGGKTIKRATGTGLSRVASGVHSAAELSGDATTSGSNVVTLASSGVTAATYGSATASPQIVFDAKGRATSAANVTVTPAVGSITGLGSGVAAVLAANANATGGVATPDGTKTLTNTTLDAAATGNILKFRQLPQLTHPHLADGTGATLGTTATAIGYGRATFSHSADETANYVEYFLHVPDDLDTSVALRARLKILLGGADTATHRYVLSSVSVADSAVPTAATLANAINLDFAGDGAGANGDVQTSAWTTLTGWAAALTPGQTWRIRLARDGNATEDASTVNSTELGLVIEYVATQ